MKPPSLVLVIDDEPQIRRLLRTALEAADYRVHNADTAQLGLVLAAQVRPDVVILDLGLPDMDGGEALKRLREWSQTPVLILSVRNDAEEIARLLDDGAEDYVTKPFHTAELLARLRALQRRALATGEPVFSRRGLVMDFTSREVTVRGEPVRLSATEYALLRVFVQHAGKVLTHRHILREVWGPKAEEHRQYLRVYLAHLRKKLGPSDDGTPWFQTETGVGYRFV